METIERASFGARLRRLREASGLSQEELAHRAGVTPNAVGTLERGERRRPYPNTVRALADALDLDDVERAEFIASVPARRQVTAAEPTLPIPPTPLIGREDDVRLLTGLLQRREARLITLTGTGGVGKTRLAVEVASQAAEEFPDGVIFVDLSPLAEANLVLPAIARSLGLMETGSVPEALQTVLARSRLLLVLDNLEHVLEAAVDIAALLVSCPDLTVLVTSRAPLRIRGETEYQVGPLEIPDPGSLPSAEKVGDAPAGQLFLQRARDASPGFSLNQRNAGTIAAICWRLEGLPLALELAAAQTRFLDPTTVLSRLDQVLQSSGARDLPPRQRTMRATLDWDHELLSEEERAVFRRLAVFAGGFTLEAAEAVISQAPISDETTLVLIGQLTEKSLVMVESQELSLTRYRMLEPVRQYSLRHLEESGEADAVRSRHATYFSALAEQGGHGLRRADQLMWLDVLSEEHDNLRAALGYLLERGDTDRAAQIGWNLWLFWSLRGHVAEGQGWMEAVLARDGGSTGRAQARALWVTAMFSYMRADMDKMIAILDEILASEDALDEETLTSTLMLRGHGLSQVGDLDAAETLLARGLDAARKTDDRWNIPHALHGITHVAMARKDFDAAERAVVESIAVARETGERWSLAIGLTIHAMLALLRGDDRLAEGLLAECTALAIVLRDPFMTAYSLTGLAVIAGRRGHGEHMAHLAGAADALRENTAIDIAATVWRTLFEEEVEGLRENLGPEDFDAAYSHGRSMTPEQLIGDLISPDSGLS